MEQQKGIIETLKNSSIEQVNELAEKLEGYKYASQKTIRRFNKLAKAKK
jgi:DeoR/GlpR family transcriptional regulator of sugar metabolism